MIGQTISHYRITAELGAGGMGVVYKAEDTKLKRTVALKFLLSQTRGSPGEIPRFLREAQAAAALNHPGICTLHDIVQEAEKTFLVMEHVEGETLGALIAKGGLPQEAAIDLAIEIARALDHAHGQGIVHRDIKPANIMLTADGQPKILDFGLAHLTDQTRITRSATVMGTVAYMSPEQATGETVDRRSDIWSLGVVLYEMITRKLPFKGDREAGMLYAVVNEPPVPLTEARSDVDGELQGVIDRALTKNPEHRYQELSELIADLETLRGGGELSRTRPLPAKHREKNRRTLLRAVSALVILAALVAGMLVLPRLLSTGPSIVSLAVLPLEDLSNEEDQGVMADGLTSELIARLSRVGSLKVTSRRSSMRFKGTEKPLSQIAEELEVGALVEGSVQVVGERIRVTAELMNPGTGDLIWADSFSAELRDILALQSDIAMRICHAIQVRLTSDERLRLRDAPEVNPAAYKAYLMGLRNSEPWEDEAWHEGIRYFNEAIDLDVSFAPAYAGLSRCYGYMSWFHDDEDYPAMQKAAALKALELDETLAAAHVAMGNHSYRFAFDWAAAEESFRRALASEPGNSQAHQDYGIYLVLAGRGDEGIPHFIQAKNLDPLNYERYRELGLGYLNARRYKESVDVYLGVRARFPGRVDTEWKLAVGYSGMGEHEHATAIIDSLERARGPGWRLGFASVYARAGRAEEALQWLDEAIAAGQASEEALAGSFVEIYAELGDYDKAFEWAEKLDRIGLLFSLNTMIGPASFREDPRHRTLMARVGL